MSQPTTLPVKVLKGKALDWAMATAECLKSETWRAKAITVLHPNAPRFVAFSPSSDWSHGGPIIEREKIDVFSSGAIWDASTADRGNNAIQSGQTPLIAAMRCLVESKLGAEIEIPTELESFVEPNNKKGPTP